ncbi:MAG: SGNH/GDSL hydrolase family protein [Myxococcota bacterium]|nr:SGNH/GDSL hydrolase family protein [Myxococcota bacterium]
MAPLASLMKLSGKKLFFSLIPFLGFLALMGAGEFAFRHITVDRDFAQFLFFTEFKVDRWRYLSANWSIHQLDVVMENPSYDHYMEPPEPNRPPFDHVPYAFDVKTNKHGFRDHDFSFDDNQKRIVVVGDSVAFGKGVSFEERFSTLIDLHLDTAQVANLGLQGCTAECMARLWNIYSEQLKPDLLIIQASGNDVDQSLWQEAMSGNLPGLGHTALSWAKDSFLLQRILYWRGADRVVQQLKMAQDKTLAANRTHIEALFEGAQSMNVPVIVLNLPYAYEHYYGGHITEVCLQYDSICAGEVRVDLSQVDAAKSLFEIPPSQVESDFVTRTAAQMPIDESTLAPVFPYRDSFLDVVHLSPQGHAISAAQLLPAVSKSLQLD